MQKENTQDPLTIQNGKIRASFLRKGAELCSLRQIDGPELIWQADPKYWGRHASLLFPIVGALKNNCYTIGGQSYSLPQHGFARNENFSLENCDKSSVLFRLTENKQTLENFPCRFILDISFRLDGSKLICGWHVSNPIESSRELIFSIGGHPAFNCPPNGSGQSGYSIGFEGASVVRSIKNNKDIILNDSRLPVTASLFDDGALVFEAPNFDAVTLNYPNGQAFVRLSHPGFPALALWNPPGGAPFVCIEPWFRSTASDADDLSLENRKNIIRLQSGEIFKAEYTIEVL